MKNLKRVLSLALSTVMLFGMMVVGTSAANYADVDASNNLEAIEVLKAVGVMEGDDKGNFNPDQNVTRNEMAVIMCNLLDLKAGGTSPFTDVPAWAQPYVAACYNNGVIAGISATEFGGSNNVTAAQASLMVMKALGYFGYQGEFGDDWKVATVKQATKIDLFDGLNVYTDEALTRNDVAQLVLNALESDVMVVTEQGGLSVEGNGIIVNQKPSYDYDNAEDRAGHNYNGAYATSDDAVYLQLCEKLYGADLKKSGSDTDDFGRPSVKWTYGTSTVKTPKAATLTYTEGVKGKTVYADLGKPNLATTTFTATVDGTASAMTIAEFASTNSTNVTDTAKGAVTEVYYDYDANTLNVVVINYYLAQATEDYNADDEDIDLVVKHGTTDVAVTLKAEDFAMIQDLEKDDYVVVTVKDPAVTPAVKTIAVADSVLAAEVTQARNNDYVIAGGTKYVYSDISEGASNAVGNALMVSSAAYTMGDEYDLYLDPNGYVLGIEGTVSEFDLSNYLFVKQIGTNGFDRIAKVLFADGTTKTVTVTKINTADVTGSNFRSGYEDLLFYSFETDKNGNYELTSVATAISGSIKVAQSGRVAGSDKDALSGVYPIETNTTQYANAATTFIAKSTVTVGVKNAPEITSVTSTDQNDVYYLYDNNNRLLLVYNTKAGSTSSNDELVYVLNTTPAKAKDGDDTYYIYTVVMNGEKTTLETTNSSIGSTGMMKIGSYTDGRADLVALAGSDTHVLQSAVSSASYKEGVLNLDTGAYILADDVIIRTLDTSDGTVKTIEASGVAKAITDGFTAATLVKVSKNDSDIAMIYLKK